MQRTLLAKALIGRPQLLILDEPTKGLDSKGQEQLFALLKTLQKEQGTSVIIVDHHMGQIITHCDNLLCLDKEFNWSI